MTIGQEGGKKNGYSNYRRYYLRRNLCTIRSYRNISDRTIITDRRSA